MFHKKILSRFTSIIESRKKRSSKRSKQSRRRVCFEALESRRVFAGDTVFFSLDLVDGGFRDNAALDATRLSTAERVATFVESELKIDLSNVSDASLTGKLREGTAGASPVFTFEMGGREWDFREGSDGLEAIDAGTESFQNKDMPMDTNGNGLLEPLDALLVVNYLNNSPTMLVPNRVASEVPVGFVDVTGDAVVSPLDALMVINELNSRDSKESSVPLLPDADYLEKQVSADETDFPSSIIDVLANDVGESLRIVSVEPGQYGTAELIESADNAGTFVVRYTPGDQFRGRDVFLYTVEDASGNQASAVVRIEYLFESKDSTTFAVEVAKQVEGSAPGSDVLFKDAQGNGLINIDYSGDQGAMIGVLLNFQANEMPFGSAIAGTLSTDVKSEGVFYPQLNGAAWIYGTVAEVNTVLAGFRFEPAPGFSSPSGLGLSVSAFLYGGLGVSSQYSSDTISVIVPALSEAPSVKNDVYTFDGLSQPVRLKVLENDSSPSGSDLQLVGVALYPSQQELAIVSHFNSSIEIDTATNEIIFTPGFGTYESFVYIVSDAAGRLSQGKVAVSFVNS
jgi:hypothetical protein